jgi:hypothetical protein
MSPDNPFASELEAAANAFAFEQWSRSFFPDSTKLEDEQMRKIWAREFMDGATWAIQSSVVKRMAEELTKLRDDARDVLKLALPDVDAALAEYERAKGEK